MDMGLCGSTTNRFIHWPSAVVSSVWSGDLFGGLCEPSQTDGKLIQDLLNQLWPQATSHHPDHSCFECFQSFPIFLCYSASMYYFQCKLKKKKWCRPGTSTMYYVLCTMYYVNAVLCVALRCSSTCAAGMQYLVSFPDPLQKAERRSSVLSDISCHKGHHKECLNCVFFKSRTQVSNAWCIWTTTQLLLQNLGIAGNSIGTAKYRL